MAVIHMWRNVHAHANVHAHGQLVPTRCCCHLMRAHPRQKLAAGLLQLSVDQVRHAQEQQAADMRL